MCFAAAFARTPSPTSLPNRPVFSSSVTIALSGRVAFFDAAGKNATAAPFTLIGNQVHSDAEIIVAADTPGPFLLVDNLLINNGRGAPVHMDALRPRIDDRQLGALDVISVGNTFSTEPHYAFARGTGAPSHRLRSVTDRTCTPSSCPSIELPALPAIVEPLAAGTIYTVLEASSAQAVLDAAAEDPGTAVVHFPAAGAALPASKTRFEFGRPTI